MSKKRKDPNGSISREALEFVKNLQTVPSEDSNGTTQADWKTVDSNLILGALYTYTAVGGAILFGTSRDGFLFSVSVYAGGEKATKWFHCIREFDDLQDYLRMIIETFGQ
jgi:hypothetical protein